MMTEELETIEQVEEVEEMPSFNHSYICWKISQAVSSNEKFAPLPELTLNIGNGITPDISVYPIEQIKPNFWQDIIRFPEMPMLAIEVISASQNIQDLIEKSQVLIDSGTKAVWTVEPFTNTVFVTTKEGKKRIHNQVVESEGIKVDFRQIFNTN
jgi:Uma2 family endonuclease